MLFFKPCMYCLYKSCPIENKDLNVILGPFSIAEEIAQLKTDKEVSNNSSPKLVSVLYYGVVFYWTKGWRTSL